MDCLSASMRAGADRGRPRRGRCARWRIPARPCSRLARAESRPKLGITGEVIDRFGERFGILERHQKTVDVRPRDDRGSPARRSRSAAVRRRPPPAGSRAVPRDGTATPRYARTPTARRCPRRSRDASTLGRLVQASISSRRDRSRVGGVGQAGDQQPDVAPALAEQLMRGDAACVSPSTPPAGRRMRP